jgi:chemotaxis methyl-accepting protein methylase
MTDDDPLLLRALELVLVHHGARAPEWLKARLAASLADLAQVTGESRAELVARMESDPELRAELGEVLRVGETRFYRDALQWNALRKALLPRLRGARLRALSAGCSTGEEAWTLAMLLDEAAENRPLRVVGLDRSRLALTAAREGLYAAESTRELPLELAQRYLAAEDGGWRVAQALRGRTSFVPRDLLQGGPPGEFDLVVCKNVLIYLAQDAGQRVLTVLETALAEQGVLLVARSEVPRARSFGFLAEELAPGVVVLRRRAHA